MSANNNEKGQILFEQQEAQWKRLEQDYEKKLINARGNPALYRRIKVEYQNERKVLEKSQEKHRTDLGFQKDKDKSPQRLTNNGRLELKLTPPINKTQKKERYRGGR